MDPDRRSEAKRLQREQEDADYRAREAEQIRQSTARVKARESRPK